MIVYVVIEKTIQKVYISYVSIKGLYVTYKVADTAL